MIKIYGNMLCPDCVQCREELDAAGVEYVYLDIGNDLLNLKQFLALRENRVFDPIKEKGAIGIPCIVLEDGTLTFDWNGLM